MTDRRGYTRSAVGATRETDSATDPEPEDRAQRETLARSIDGAKDPSLGGSVRQTLAGEPEAGGA
jgi:hypothetical protein